MHKKKNGNRVAGREPRRAATPKVGKNTDQNLIDILKVVLETQREQTKMMAAWFQLFQPTRPNLSTSFEDLEEQESKNEIPEEWDPMTPEDLEALIKGMKDGSN